MVLKFIDVNKCATPSEALWAWAWEFQEKRFFTIFRKGHFIYIIPLSPRFYFRDLLMDVNILANPDFIVERQISILLCEFYILSFVF